MLPTHYLSGTPNQRVDYSKHKETSRSEIAKGKPIPGNLPINNSFDSSFFRSVYDGVVQLPNQQKDLKSKEYKKNTQNLLRAINQTNRSEMFDSLRKGNVDINVKNILKNQLLTI